MRDELTEEEHQELMERFESIDAENLTDSDIAFAQELYVDFPEIWNTLSDMAREAENKLIDNNYQQIDIFGRKQIENGLRKFRSDLSYSTSSALEKTLIDQILICWLRLYFVEDKVSNLSKSSHPVREVEFWDKRQNAAQMRFLRATESLARIKRMKIVFPQVQINIAKQGGNQINIVGDPKANTKVGNSDEI